MITFSNVSKQYGGQILFLEASFYLGDAEKVGLVGPNGAGKSTVFRLITGEEHPDDGLVDRPKRTTIGYFRQDVGDPQRSKRHGRDSLWRGAKPGDLAKR